MLATIRDTNTGAALLPQDARQLELFYEKVVPDIIHTNSYVKIYTGTINQKRAEQISASIETKLVMKKSFSSSDGIFFGGSDRNKQAKQGETPILASNEIQ